MGVGRHVVSSLLPMRVPGSGGGVGAGGAARGGAGAGRGGAGRGR